MPSPYAPPTYGGPVAPTGSTPSRLMKPYPFDPDGTSSPPEYSPDMTEVISLGGWGSRSNDAWQRMVGKVAPGAIQIPIGELGMAGALKKLNDSRARLAAEGKKHVEIGHSLGGSTLFNNPDQGTNSGAIIADAPYKTSFENAPRWLQGFFPPVAAITKASRGGIQYSPDLVDWTKGKTVINPLSPMKNAHNPPANPGFPGNPDRIDAIQDLLRSKMNAFTNQPPPRRP